jgi:hypothetical protein
MNQSIIQFNRPSPLFSKTCHHQKKRSEKIERRGRMQGEWEQTKERKEEEEEGNEKRNSESIKSKNEQLLPPPSSALHLLFDHLEALTLIYPGYEWQAPVPFWNADGMYLIRLYLSMECGSARRGAKRSSRQL